jgi:hypothetical protein
MDAKVNGPGGREKWLNVSVGSETDLPPSGMDAGAIATFCDPNQAFLPFTIAAPNSASLSQRPISCENPLSS